MSADKHFHPPAPVPDALEDHQPDDMPAARGVILGQAKKHAHPVPPDNTEQVQ
jgi:hypothetical protein